MNKNGPIIIIEDDLEDQKLLEETFKVLNYPNKVIFFSNGYSALEFLTSSRSIPFLILSDINMPIVNGFELQRQIRTNEKLKEHCIPYLFFSTNANREAVTEAYALSAQGFFVKPNSVAQLQKTMRKIIEYWYESFSPNQYVEISNE